MIKLPPSRIKVPIGVSVGVIESSQADANGTPWSIVYGQIASADRQVAGVSIVEADD